MGFQLNATPGAQVDISGDVTISSTQPISVIPSAALPAGANRKVLGGLISITANTVTDIYSVTASKDFYITAIITSTSHTGAPILKIGDKATLTNSYTPPIQEANVAIIAVSPRVTGFSMSGCYIFPIPLKVDETISCVLNASLTLEYTIIGYEI